MVLTTTFVANAFAASFARFFATRLATSFARFLATFVAASFARFLATSFTFVAAFVAFGQLLLIRIRLFGGFGDRLHLDHIQHDEEDEDRDEQVVEVHFRTG
jgi:vacuolar-type H+-ATPase subunit I/STV1